LSLLPLVRVVEDGLSEFRTGFAEDVQIVLLSNTDPPCILLLLKLNYRIEARSALFRPIVEHLTSPLLRLYSPLSGARRSVVQIFLPRLA